MIKRTIEISGRGNHLYLYEGSLCVRQGRQIVGRVPLEDLGLLILDAADTTYTHRLVTDALGAGAAILLCGADHHPAGLFLPQNNTRQTKRIRNQAAASKPLHKRLWKQIVQSKIRNQAAALSDGPAARRLRSLVTTVRSGDTANVEAHAARRYWRMLFGEDFRRSRDGPPPNPLLNYGYMALRAAVARAVCAAGLHPSLGLHHHNRGNAFCLADDLLEPLRPLVDIRVRQLLQGGTDAIDRRAKCELLGVLAEEIEVGGVKGPLSVALERTLASLVACYAGQRKDLELPVLWS
ncbi:MAG: type II CRISPR-associated endonuclease Cas1 [Phycisphaerae bacterium]|nr:type II CRISPR-associated endonuclease Cas1 [Phycisphaerae bacterium]